MAQTIKVYQLDKTFLEIKNAFLAGKKVLLQYNNQIIQQIVGFDIYKNQDSQTSDIIYEVYIEIFNKEPHISPYVNSFFNSFEQAINNEQYPIVTISTTDQDLIDPIIDSGSSQ